MSPFSSRHVGVCISVCTLHTFSNWHKSIRGQKKKQWPLCSKIMMWSRSEDVLRFKNAPLPADASFSQLLGSSSLEESGSTFIAYIVIINSLIIQALYISKSLGWSVQFFYELWRAGTVVTFDGAAQAGQVSEEGRVVWHQADGENSSPPRGCSLCGVHFFFPSLSHRMWEYVCMCVVFFLSVSWVILQSTWKLVNFHNCDVL